MIKSISNKQSKDENFKSVILGLFKINNLIDSCIDKPENIHLILITCLEILKFKTDHEIYSKFKKFFDFCFS